MMEIHTDSFFSTVDRVSRRLGPLNSVITLLADRVTPRSIAKADTCPPPGVYICSVTCEYDATCCSLGNLNREVVIYAGSPSQCVLGFQARCTECATSCGTCNE